MKILRKDTMPNGTAIQLEDWSEHNTPEYPDLYGLTIGAYPIAVNPSLFRPSGECFRLTIAANPYTNYIDDDVFADYEDLVSGKKSLQDLAAHFWYDIKDRWSLGMFTPETDEWYMAQSKYQFS
jgi:hypothetical protein